MPLIVLVGNVFLGSPGQLNADRMAEAVVEHLELGNCLMNSANERNVVRAYAARIPKRGATIVLGSSRVLPIGPSSTGTDDTFNLGVSSASLEDIFSILEILYEQDIHPARVILGLEDWFLNGNADLHNWRKLATEFSAYLLRAGLEDPTDGRLLRFGSDYAILGFVRPDLFYDLSHITNLRYFQSGIYDFARQILRTGKYSYFSALAAATTVDPNDTGGWCQRRAYWYRARSPEQIEQMAKEWGREPFLETQNAQLQYYRQYREHDPRAIERVERIVADLAVQGTEVVLYLAPWHPSAYAQFQETSIGRLAILAEAKYR
ncbi:hypothetical protein WDZ92_32370, partial [Nostoc sp. NIES-2111]